MNKNNKCLSRNDNNNVIYETDDIVKNDYIKKHIDLPHSIINLISKLNLGQITFLNDENIDSFVSIINNTDEIFYEIS